jgi:polysaccharide pyruvyl transferase WcaK-like protein
LLAQLAATSIVVSPRYHNLLLALLLGKPVVSVSYDPKNDALVESVGLGEYRQPIEALDVPLLVHQVLDLERQSDRCRAEIEQNVARFREDWRNEYQAVLEGVVHTCRS